MATQQPEPELAAVMERLKRLEPRIQKIMQITGLPGCSIGVIHQGVEVWKFNAGFRDVENQLPPQSDTVFNLNSLTKSLTAAALACLVQDGKLSWDTPIRSILPDFAEGCDAVDQSITSVDLLSMRTGHFAFNNMAWQGNNIVLPKKEGTVRFWNATPRIAPFRKSFVYNNWGYGIIALVIEKLSGQSFHAFLQERFFDPLDLKRTKMQDDTPFENSSKAYAVLDDRSPIPIPPPSIGAGVFTEGGSGVLSTIDDMLRLYHAYMLAINHQSQSGSTSTPDNPFNQCYKLVEPHSTLPRPGRTFSVEEQNYCLGLIRAQLPGPLGMMGMNADFNEWPPVVLEGFLKTLCFYHQGMMVGSTSNIAILPESETVVAVLANAFPLGDGADWISQMIIEAIFDPPTKKDFEETAEDVALEVLELLPGIGDELRDRHSRYKLGALPTLPLPSYVGTFKHEAVPFTLDIKLEQGELTMTFNGCQEETYPLRPYDLDTFTWWTPFNEAARRGRFVTCYPRTTFLISFEKEASRIAWASGDILDQSYYFLRVE
ncbi:beta-lactamase/transpeptidase-like protein [Dactylonectria estremocensis]|uniref:Beta-lactamase/transpeptidase-like protein n=1 Tax=Dactylonectria estremocensis TaxID=1079267 RepID=A0A9P9FC73_9HYPO|nr:beta-lactamase/transpeptidase-like protein [Dactylonectria estremocensis]